jgi:hypothetical protein
MKEQGWSIDPQAMAAGDKSEVYGQSLQRAETWDNATGGFSKAAVTATHYFEDNYKLVDDPRNPARQLSNRQFECSTNFCRSKRQ